MQELMLKILCIFIIAYLLYMIDNHMMIIAVRVYAFCECVIYHSIICLYIHYQMSIKAYINNKTNISVLFEMFMLYLKSKLFIIVLYILHFIV